LKTLIRRRSLSNLSELALKQIVGGVVDVSAFTATNLRAENRDLAPSLR
jgi:hypothetical protein